MQNFLHLVGFALNQHITYYPDLKGEKKKKRKRSTFRTRAVWPVLGLCYGLLSPCSSAQAGKHGSHRSWEEGNVFSLTHSAVQMDSFLHLC